MDTIILFSFFNSNNLGDKALSGLFFKNLSEKHCVIRCSNEGDFNIYGKYVGEKLGIFEKIKCKILIFAGKQYRSPKYNKFRKEYERYLESCSAVVFGGGNILMDYSEKTNSYIKFKEYISMAKAKGKKCFALSIGIGPFATDKQLKNAVETLNGCEYVSFRDEASYRLFTENGGRKEIAKISADPVFTLQYDGKKNEESKVVAVNVVDPGWYGENYKNKVLEDYSGLVKYLAERFPKKQIVLFSTELNDIGGMEKIYNSCKEQENIFMEKPSSIEELKGLYERSEVVIGARMHSLIIAYSCKTPVIGLSWTKKVNGFFGIIGKPQRCFALEDISSHFSDISEMTESGNSGWNYEEVIRNAGELLLKDLEEIG